MKRFVIIYVALVFLLNVSLAQKSNESIESRLERIEKSEQLRYENNEIQMKNLQLNADKVLEEKKKDLDVKLTEINDNIKLYAPIIISINIIAIVAFFISAFLYIDKQMKNKIDAIIIGKEDSFRRMVSNQEIESKIKKNMQLLVISPSEYYEEMIRYDITLFKFSPEQVRYKVVSSEQDGSSLEYLKNDIVIINDIEGKFDRSILEKILNNIPDNVLLLGYATGEIQLPRHPKMNYSNSKFTFYQNLINLAKFKEVIL